MPDVKDKPAASSTGGNDPRATPAMRQFYRFKKEHPGCILLFRMGDFYETFDEDAVAIHKALGVTLTERTSGIPMAGVPYHAIDGYLRRLIEQGFRVAVCDQVQDPKEARGVVDRAVTRVLSPGALVDESLLADDEANVLGAIAFLGVESEPGARAALALVELSTGAFSILDCPVESLVDELVRRGVREALYAETADGEMPPRIKRVLDGAGIPGAGRPAWHFRRDEAFEAVTRQYGVASLAGFGLRDDDPSIPAAGAIIRFLRETQSPDGIPESHSQAARTALRPLAHLSPPKRETGADFLVIDAPGMRALEIERTVRGSATGEDFSLVGLFLRAGAGGGCRTSMGKRLVREWLRRPLAQRAAIEARHACVGMLVGDRRMLEAVGDAIDGVQDVARIGGRLALGRATPRDLSALGRSLARTERILDALRINAGENAFGAIVERLDAARTALQPLADDIGASCVDDPPSHLREGGLFRDGVDDELDEARTLQRDASAWLASYQRTLSEQHNLPNLKVGFNKVFGYFIELPRAQAQRAPDAFRRTQTLTNAERYTTPELKTFEEKVTTASDRAIAREQALFDALCARAGANLREIAAFAETVAEIDALRCFAAHAARRAWTRPQMTDEPALDIEQGRHPVLESILADGFVPNDLKLGANGGAAPLALITGPNMAGKSTFIRQTALLVILAHAGSFVPAHRATIGVADRVFTRVGADDALHAGQSTFMVEMTETANILHHRTGRSIVVLDEIGRGTSTLDGLALAWAIGEFLASDPQPRTLFATHYHELTQLEELLPGRVQNLHVAVREWPPGDAHAQIVFLHRILAGRTDRSYGVQVARLAGLPREVVARARELLDSLAVSHEGRDAQALKESSSRKKKPDDAGQLALFREFLPHPAVEELSRVEIERMTPLEAFDALRKLRGMVDGAGG